MYKFLHVNVPWCTSAFKFKYLHVKVCSFKGAFIIQVVYVYVHACTLLGVSEKYQILKLDVWKVANWVILVQDSNKKRIRSLSQGKGSLSQFAFFLLYKRGRLTLELPDVSRHLSDQLSCFKSHLVFYNAGKFEEQQKITIFN